MKMHWGLLLNVFLLDRKLVLNMSKSSFKRAFFDQNSWFLPMRFLRVGHHRLISPRMVWKQDGVL